MEGSKMLQIAMFPWLAFGHMIPFLELSKRLAAHGHHIFYISTPRNLERLPKIPQNLAPLITLVPLQLPRIKNLPVDAEATTDVGFEMGHDLLKTAYDGLQQPMKLFLEASTLDWIMYDFPCYWLPPIVDQLGIRKVGFCIFNARLFTLLGPKSEMAKEDGAGILTDSDFLICPPWLKSKSISTHGYCLPFEARMFFQSLTTITSSGVSDFFRAKSWSYNCDLIAVRTCLELEDEDLQILEKLNEKIVLPVGLLLPSTEETEEDNTMYKPIFDWLEKQSFGSVVYVAFGSEVVPSQEQITELAHGLLLSGFPFLWVFRKSGNSSIELPDGFQDKARDRGLVWTSWVPQLRILNHESIGGILTHAGWSSMIETLAIGKPLIMLPLMVDQGVNARVMAERKVGIEIPRNKEDGSFTRNSVAESLTLVLQEEAGQIYRDEAKKISAIVGNKNLQEQYISKFNDFLCDHKSVV